MAPFRALDTFKPLDAEGGVEAMGVAGKQGIYRGIKWSGVAAVVLLLWDVAISGWFGASLIFCPIWFLVSLLKNAIQRPGWRLAILRVGIPAMTLGLAWANNAVQLRVAEENASRVVAACERYRAANGKFPMTLDELVPQYLPSVPRAKYCLMWGDFVCFNYNHGKPMLVWYVAPPHLRRIYDFESRRWNYIE